MVIAHICGLNISSGERAALTESPDHSGDPEGEVAALEAAEDGWAAGDADEGRGTDHTALVDEAPHEPSHEVIVNMVEVSDGLGKR